MPKYKVVNLSNEPDGEGGWSVSSAHYIMGLEIEVPEHGDAATVLKILQDADVAAFDATPDEIYIDSEISGPASEGRSIWIRCNKEGEEKDMWLWELQPVR